MNGDKFNYGYPVMPDGNGDYEPVPPSLNAEQAARYIGLQVKNPEAAIRRLRQSGQIKAKKVGRTYRFTPEGLNEYLNGEN